jgi:hypothetical protein
MMKTYFGCGIAAAAAFVFMGLQTGLFGLNRHSAFDEEQAEVVAATRKRAKERAKFPDDLAPAARAQPVAVAADFKVADKPHKLAFLKANGALHPWHNDSIDYNEDWTATSVEETELVIIVSGQSKSMIERVTFSNGPPVDRNRWELEASVVEAKTGRVLAQRSFVNLPRAVRPQEAYELTALGSPVHILTVFNWVAGQAKKGFSAATNAKPLVTVLENQ